MSQLGPISMKKQQHLKTLHTKKQRKYSELTQYPKSGLTLKTLHTKKHRKWPKLPKLSDFGITLKNLH